MSKAEEAKSRTFREKRYGREISPEDAEKVELAMRQIIDAIAVEVHLEAAVPEVADTIDAPFRARNVRPSGFNRVKITDQHIFGEGVIVRIRAHTKTDVVLRDAVRSNAIAVTLIERQSDRVFGNLIMIENAAIEAHSDCVLLMLARQLPAWCKQRPRRRPPRSLRKQAY